MRHADLPSAEPPGRNIQVLWGQYTVLKAAIDDLGRRSKLAQLDSDRIGVELETLDPMLATLDELAAAIGEIPAASDADVRVKARVLSDYLDENYLDLTEKLALALCIAVLGRNTD